MLSLNTALVARKPQAVHSATTQLPDGAAPSSTVASSVTHDVAEFEVAHGSDQGPSLTVLALSPPPGIGSFPRLCNAGRWSPANRAFLDGFLKSLQGLPRGAPPPVAVFDWDDTSMVGDTSSLWMRSAFENLEITLSPDALASTLTAHACDMKHLRTNLSLEDLRADIIDAYRLLYPAIQAEDLVSAKASDAYQDFRAKMAIYFEEFTLSPRNPGLGDYQCLQWFTGLHVNDLKERIGRALEKAKQVKKPTAAWSTATGGRTGPLTYTYCPQVAQIDEMKDLMSCLKQARVRVCVVSASIEQCLRPVVKALGYPVVADDIFATQAAVDSRGRLTGKLVPRDVRAPCVGSGKTDVIKGAIRSAPIFVAGDSNGDVNMLSDFTETQVRFIVDRNRKSGPIVGFYEAGKVAPPAQTGPVRTLVQAFVEPSMET